MDVSQLKGWLLIMDNGIDRDNLEEAIRLIEQAEAERDLEVATKESAYEEINYLKGVNDKLQAEAENKRLTTILNSLIKRVKPLDNFDEYTVLAKSPIETIRIIEQALKEKDEEDCHGL